MGEEVRKSVNWGYILEAPGRPPLKEQREFMKAAGVSLAEYGPCFHDRVSQISTRPRNQLIDRKTLMLAVDPGDTVNIAAEFCVGVSTTDARWFIHDLVNRGVNLRIAGKDIKIGCIEEVVEEVGRRQNTHNVRTFRSLEKLRARRKARMQQVQPEASVSWVKRPCVYRHFDIEGCLLYVGSCTNYARRMIDHKSQAPWFSQINRESIEFYETLSEALAVERRAIWFEKPMYNRQRHMPPAQAFLEEAAKLAGDEELAARILKLSD
jgi:hypothetical protein